MCAPVVWVESVESDPWIPVVVSVDDPVAVPPVPVLVVVSVPVEAGPSAVVLVPESGGKSLPREPTGAHASAAHASAANRGIVVGLPHL